MDKTVICSIPMKKREDVVPSTYLSEDTSISVSKRKVRYPVNAFLENNVQKGTKLNVILLVKESEHSAGSENVKDFQEELETAVKDLNIGIKYTIIKTEFSQDKLIHEKLMELIVDQTPDGAHIIADMTYGPKDLPIVIFSALEFAEKFLNCEIEHILYGQAEFDNGSVVNTKICDMVPLFYLSSVTNLIHAGTPDKAREMLKTLLKL